MKDAFVDKNSKFGVDLGFPKIGGGARKTNYDYTKGNMDKLIDIIIEEGKIVFLCNRISILLKF